MQAPTATRERRGIRFSWILPLGQLTLCALLLWPARAWIFFQLGFPRRLNVPSMASPYGGSVAQKLGSWSMDYGMETAAVLNLPAGLVQLPYAIFSPNHREMAPRGVDFKTWRAMSWPILGTFFWWIAGRGAEALAASRRRVLIPGIRWVEATIGFLLLASGVTLAVAFVFTAGPDRHDRMLQFVIMAALLWAFLGALPFTAKILQWRLRKKLAAASAIATSSPGSMPGLSGL
jgi:hypothetical protein